jgi:hypothetical protein
LPLIEYINKNILYCCLFKKSYYYHRHCLLSFLFFRETTLSTKVLNLHGYKLPNCIMRVFHLHIHLFFVYFKLVQWALKFKFHIEVDTTWEGTDGSAYYVDGRNQIDRGLLNKTFYFSYFPCQSYCKSNDKDLDDWGLVPARATQNSLHQFPSTYTEPHSTPCLIASEDFLLTD